MTSAVIVAAGQATRMGPQVDKLFLEVAGRPVVAHTWARFDGAACIDEIILVVREGLEAAFEDLARRFGFTKPHRLARGGRERQDSVWNGLQALDQSADFVAVHDAARPCTSVETLTATLAAAWRTGAAVSAQRVTDTLKESDGGVRIARTVDRARFWAVQTPQAFRVDVIRRALRAVREQGLVVTDDTAACELIHQPVELVENTAPNPKVTVPADLPYLEMLLGSRRPG
jgi:2-C-methyl-D-erythritol 4-phosphate cytidylyltransferase